MAPLRDRRPQASRRASKKCSVCSSTVSTSPRLRGPSASRRKRSGSTSSTSSRSSACTLEPRRSRSHWAATWPSPLSTCFAPRTAAARCDRPLLARRTSQEPRLELRVQKRDGPGSQDVRGKAGELAIDPDLRSVLLDTPIIVEPALVAFLSSPQRLRCRCAVREPKQLQQLATLGRGEPAQDLVLHLSRHLPAALPQAPALRRENHLARAAIAGMGSALGKPGGLEVVDQLDHGAGIDAHRRAELLLVRSLEAAEQVE